MTLEKIAKKANVSVSTVSRALNNSYDIAPDTKELVLSIAEECGYFAEKKRTKIGNKDKGTANIAIICPEIISQYYSSVAENFVQEFKSRNCRCTIYNSDFDRTSLEIIMKKCINDPDTDAIISLSAIDFELGRTDIPVIALGEWEKSGILSDMKESIDCAVAYLENKNIKRIAFAGEKLTTGKAENFQECCGKRGIEHSVFTSSARFDDAGKEAAEHFLKAELPEAVLCAYDEIAYGLIYTLKECGVRVPEDVRVIGINDIPSAKYCFGGLSTVSFDFKAICPAVAEDILNDIRTGQNIRRIYNVKSKLIIRNT